jgi:hypothetical protein
MGNRRVRSIAAYAKSGLVRRPGRTAISAATLGLAVACLTGLLIATFAFRGSVAGSLLGNYVTVQIRVVDYLSAGLAVLLACFSVADLLALTVRERAAEIVTLKATGWADAPSRLGDSVGSRWHSATRRGPGEPARYRHRHRSWAPVGMTLLVAVAATALAGFVVLAFAAIPARAATRIPVSAALSDE